MRLLITGSRGWTAQEALWARLDRLCPQIIGHGNCRGADLTADAWALERGVEALRFPADWHPQGRFDRGAGRRRNVEMLGAFGPDLVAAFKDGFDFDLRSGGTEHMVKIALAAGVPCQVMDSVGIVDELFPLEQTLFKP